MLSIFSVFELCRVQDENILVIQYTVLIFPQFSARFPLLGSPRFQHIVVVRRVIIRSLLSRSDFRKINPALCSLQHTAYSTSRVSSSSLYSTTYVLSKVPLLEHRRIFAAIRNTETGLCKLKHRSYTAFRPLLVILQFYQCPSPNSPPLSPSDELRMS